MQGPTTSTGDAGAARHSMPHVDGGDNQTRSTQPPQPSQSAYASSTATYRQPNAGYRRQRSTSGIQLAKALGWFSIGLGVMELLMPRKVARMAGIDADPAVLRGFGARELASGAGILSDTNTGNWLWLRVAGDAMDLAYLGWAASRNPGSTSDRRQRVALAAVALAGVTALDIMSSIQTQRREREQGIDGASGAIHVDKCVTVNRPADECYRFWRDFENFPRFMQHLESVQKTSDTRSHWVAKAPAGTSVEWDADIVADEPGSMFAWRSVDGADVDHAGVVRFEPAPAGRGTIVRVELQCRPPGGTAGALAAKLFGEAPDRSRSNAASRLPSMRWRCTGIAPRRIVRIAHAENPGQQQREATPGSMHSTIVLR